MYDHVTSINSVTVTVHEATAKNSLLTEYRCQLKKSPCQCFIARTLFLFFMANKVPAVVQFAYTLKSLSLGYKSLTTTLLLINLMYT